jgi:hypothetical protein
MRIPTLNWAEIWDRNPKDSLVSKVTVMSSNQQCPWYYVTTTKFAPTSFRLFAMRLSPLAGNSELHDG